MKKPTKKELRQLAEKVESEGFGYYMLAYGPDLNLIERMGYNREEVENAIDLFERLECEISEYLGDEDA